MASPSPSCNCESCAHARRRDGVSQNKATPAIREALLSGGRIVEVYAHDGSPGGHNNDRVVLTMESGARVSFDAYSGGSLKVTERL